MIELRGQRIKGLGIILILTVVVIFVDRAKGIGVLNISVLQIKPALLQGGLNVFSKSQRVVSNGPSIVYKETHPRSLSTGATDSLPKSFLRRRLIQENDEVDLSNINSQLQSTCRDDANQITLG